MNIKTGKKKILALIIVLAVAVSVAAPSGAAFAAGNEVTMRFRPGEGSGVMEAAVLKPGSSYVLPDCSFTPPEGKEFDMWFVTIYGGRVPYIRDDAHADGRYKAGETISMPAASTADISAEALWKDRYYDVVFEMNGAKAQQESQKIKHGGFVQKPYAYPQKDSYVFVDWYSDEGLNNVFDFDDQEPVTGDMTLYAGWGNYAGVKAYEDGVRGISYAGYVSVNGDEREGVSATLALEGEKVAFSAEVNKPGYKFVGWYKDGGVLIPEPVGTVLSTDRDFSVTMGSKTENYCAVFKKCEATFDTRGGAAIAPVTVNAEGKIAEPKAPTGPTSDYKFSGWYNDPGFGDKYDFSTVLTDDIKLYARYKVPVSLGTYDETKEYTSGGGSVRFSSGSRSSQFGAVKQGLEGEEFTVVAEPVNGYEFAGWAKDTPDGEVISADNSYTFTVSGPTYLYALFHEVHEHDWGEWVVTREPTEEMNGEARRVCKLDPSHVETIELSVNDGGDDGLSAESAQDEGIGAGGVIWIVCGIAAAVVIVLLVLKRRGK